MTPHPLALIAAFAAVVTAQAEVDPAKRDEDFSAKAVEQQVLPKERASLGGTRKASENQLEFVTVPLTTKEAHLPGVRTKEIAPVSMEARPIPVRNPQPSVLSTSNAAPSKFEKKSEPRMVSRFQESMDGANRVQSAQLKPEKKRTVLERINRFVFRRNEPAPAATPAGGKTEPKKSGSGSP